MCIHLWLSKIGSPMYIASIAHRWFDYEWLCSNFDSSCYMNWTGWLDTRAVVYHTYTPCGCILFILYLARINELFTQNHRLVSLLANPVRPKPSFHWLFSTCFFFWVKYDVRLNYCWLQQLQHYILPAQFPPSFSWLMIFVNSATKDELVMWTYK